MMSGGGPVIVAGMHRSGTSAVARVLNLLGVDLGSEADLLEAQSDNASGFWENRDVVRLNDDLIAHLGGRWDEPPFVSEMRSVEGYEAFLDRAQNIVGSFAGTRPGFKDPRASLLLSFWLEVWPTATVVVCTRHPLSVAASLARRDGFDEQKSAELWLRYTLDALTSTPDRVVVAFEDVLESPERSVGQLVSDLGLDFSDESLRRAIATVDTGLVRASSDAEFHGSKAMTAAVQVYELLSTATPEIVDLMAAGAREPALRVLRENAKRTKEISAQFHVELVKAQEDFRTTQDEADDARALAERRLQALSREERAREELAVRLSRAEESLATLEAELAWRRAVQYRFEKVLGRRLMMRLSGHREGR